MPRPFGMPKPMAQAFYSRPFQGSATQTNCSRSFAIQNEGVRQRTGFVHHCIKPAPSAFWRGHFHWKRTALHSKHAPFQSKGAPFLWKCTHSRCKLATLNGKCAAAKMNLARLSTRIVRHARHAHHFHSWLANLPWKAAGFDQGVASLMWKDARSACPHHWRADLASRGRRRISGLARHAPGLSRCQN